MENRESFRFQANRGQDSSARRDQPDIDVHKQGQPGLGVRGEHEDRRCGENNSCE